MKLLIIVNQLSVYSETFIQSHISDLSDDPVLLYSGNQVFYRGQTIGVYSKLNRIQFYIAKLLKQTKLDLKSYLVMKKLQAIGVEKVIAEYGYLGIRFLPIAQEAKMELTVFFRGADVYAGNPIFESLEKYNKLFSYAQNIVCVSKDIQNVILRAGCPKEKTFWLPSGADKTYFDIEVDFTSNHFIALGRFVNKKAPHLVIMAFSKVLDRYPFVTLSIGGTGDLLQSCKDLVHFLEIEKSVSFPGVLNTIEIKTLFSKSCAFLQHSVKGLDGDSEGTPNSVMEASAAGLPVIATKHGGIPDVIQHGITGYLVNEGDFMDMANCMMEIIENKISAKQMGQKGREFIRQNFTREINIKTTKKILNIN